MGVYSWERMYPVVIFCTLFSYLNMRFSHSTTLLPILILLQIFPIIECIETSTLQSRQQPPQKKAFHFHTNHNNLVVDPFPPSLLQAPPLVKDIFSIQTQQIFQDIYSLIQHATIQLLRLLKHTMVFYSLGFEALPFLQLSSVLLSRRISSQFDSRRKKSEIIVQQRTSLALLFFLLLQLTLPFTLLPKLTLLTSQFPSGSSSTFMNQFICLSTITLLFVNFSLGEHLLTSSSPSLSSSSPSIQLLDDKSHRLIEGIFVYFMTSQVRTSTTTTGYLNILQPLSQIALGFTTVLVSLSQLQYYALSLRSKIRSPVNQKISPVKNVTSIMIAPSNDTYVGYVQSLLNYFVYSNLTQSALLSSSSPSLISTDRDTLASSISIDTNTAGTSPLVTKDVTSSRRVASLKKRRIAKDFVPNSLGIKTVSNGYLKLLPRHSIIPLQRSYILTVSALDVQSDDIVIQVMEGNLMIGQLLLRGFSDKKITTTQIEVRLHINLQGVLKMQAREYSSTQEQQQGAISSRSLVVSKQMSLLSEEQVIEIWNSNLNSNSNFKNSEYTSFFRKPMGGGYSLSPLKKDLLVPRMHSTLSYPLTDIYKDVFVNYSKQIEALRYSDWLLQLIPFLSTSLFASLFTSLLLKVYSQPSEHLRFMSKYHILLGAIYLCLHTSILPLLQHHTPYVKSYIQNILSIVLSIPFTKCVLDGLQATSPSRAYLFALYFGLLFMYAVPSVHCILLPISFPQGTTQWQPQDLRNMAQIITCILQIGVILLTGNIWAGTSFFLVLFYGLHALQMYLLRTRDALRKS